MIENQKAKTVLLNIQKTGTVMREEIVQEGEVGRETRERWCRLAYLAAQLNIPIDEVSSALAGEEEQSKKPIQRLTIHSEAGLLSVKPGEHCIIIGMGSDGSRVQAGNVTLANDDDLLTTSN